MLCGTYIGPFVDKVRHMDDPEARNLVMPSAGTYYRITYSVYTRVRIPYMYVSRVIGDHCLASIFCTVTMPKCSV